MEISAAIITYNEEQNIKDCLMSLLPVADEIIVVDSFSTDKTAEICESFKKVTFIKKKFDGHVQQKNYAVSQTTNSFVLSLDADERLDKELIASIKAKKQSTPDHNSAYEFARLSSFCGQWIKHSGWYPDRKVRLWHKNYGQWGGKNPHDRVILNDGITVSVLKGSMLHYTFRTIEEHMNQINKFSSIAAQAMFEKSKTKNVWINILFGPLFTFIKKYFIQAGFLDGFYGFIIAKNSAHAKFLKYVKYQQLKKSA